VLPRQHTAPRSGPCGFAVPPVGAFSAADSLVERSRDPHVLEARSRRREGMPGAKMIEAGGYAEPAVDPRIVFFRHIRNSQRFQKGNKLIAPDIEKEVSKAPAFFDPYRVGDDRLKPQKALLSRPVHRLRWPRSAMSCAPGVETTDIVDHGWAQSIYFNGPNGLSLEYCCVVRACRP
jgi:hypothetical protein